MNSIIYSFGSLTGRACLSSVVFLLVLIAVLHGSLTDAHAVRSVTFSWSANPEVVDGYKLYYKTGTRGAPYNGTGAIQGASPVRTGNVTSYTLTGLSENATYYFVLTAYKGSLESGFSQELILNPVASGNATPTATNRSFSTVENSQFRGTLSASDPDGDPLTYRIVQNGRLGSAVISNSSTGAFTYTPSRGASGTDVFSFKVNDGTVDSNTATITVRITALNNPPTAVISSSAPAGAVPFLVRFDGTGSTDGDGTIAAYSWDFGDGKTASGARVSHTYVDAGNYSVRLRVTDNSGTSDTATLPIVVTRAGNKPPKPIVSASSARGKAPLPVTFDATGSYDADGRIVRYRWNFNDGTTASGPRVTHVFADPGVYDVVLRVTDDKGVTSSLTYAIQALDVRASIEDKKFPWELVMPIIQRNIAVRQKKQRNK